MDMRPMVRACMMVKGVTGTWQRTRTSSGSLSSASVRGGIKDAVHFYDAAGLVELVFDAGAEGNFDHRLKFARNVFAGAEVVPRMHRNSSGNDFRLSCGIEKRANW